eukprot:s1146_g5.t5
MVLGIVLVLLPLCAAQQAGTLKTEGNPTMAVKECTKAQGCTTKEHKLVLDANWRWIHTTEGYKNCYTGNTWDSSICSDPDACAQGCALEAVDAAQYESIYGITEVPGGVKLNFVTGSNVGSRLFLLEDDDTYKLFKLKNREFALDVDSSTVECGMNGAMYFEMAADGGKGRGYNAAGAKYGTGYCDAQCPHDVKFIGGSANTKDWKPHPKDFSNTIGLGHYGSCCAEMDIWEANNMATAYTPHPCNIDVPGQYVCEGTECGDNDSGERYDGLCDKDGCDINPFRNGNTSFYGQGSDFAVDSSRPMTVVTQFLTTDGTDEGDLSEIRRFYVQDGRAIASPPITILPQTPDSITDGMCETTAYVRLGNTAIVGGHKGALRQQKRLQRERWKQGHGHVSGSWPCCGTVKGSLRLRAEKAFSLWDDIDVHMMWLDSCYPEDKPCSDPGVHRGMCPGGEESAPQNVRRKHTFGHVIFANAAVGEIGTTQSEYPGSSVTSLPSTTASMPTETTTTTELTATMPTETTTTTELTTTGISTGVWEPVDGGEGRACRGSSRSDNRPQYYQLVRGITSLEDCQMHCAATAGCRGVEFSGQRCEVWLRAEGIEATIALPGFTCMRYDGPLVTTTTPMPGTWSPVDGGDGRACRGASSSDNSANYYNVVPGLVNLDACKARCQITDGCQGVEFKIGRCEIWTRPQGIQASIPLAGFTCLSYQSGGAVSTMPPSTATTHCRTTGHYDSISVLCGSLAAVWRAKSCRANLLLGGLSLRRGQRVVFAVPTNSYARFRPSCGAEAGQPPPQVFGSKLHAVQGEDFPRSLRGELGALKMRQALRELASVGRTKAAIPGSSGIAATLAGLRIRGAFVRRSHVYVKLQKVYDPRHGYCAWSDLAAGSKRKPFQYQEDAPDGGLMDFLEGEYEKYEGYDGFRYDIGKAMEQVHRCEFLVQNDHKIVNVRGLLNSQACPRPPRLSPCPASWSARSAPTFCRIIVPNVQRLPCPGPQREALRVFLGSSVESLLFAFESWCLKGDGLMIGHLHHKFAHLHVASSADRA